MINENDLAIFKLDILFKRNLMTEG